MGEVCELYINFYTIFVSIIDIYNLLIKYRMDQHDLSITGFIIHPLIQVVRHMVAFIAPTSFIQTIPTYLKLLP